MNGINRVTELIKFKAEVKTYLFRHLIDLIGRVIREPRFLRKPKDKIQIKCKEINRISTTMVGVMTFVSGKK